LFGLAGTYRYELGEERAALPLLQAYVGLRPDDAAASFRIGMCLLRMSLLPTGAPQTQDQIAQTHAEAAARAFQRCVRLAPGDEDAALAVGAATLRAAALSGDRGERNVQAERLGQAAAQFASVAERFLESAEAMFRLGVVEEARDRVEQARAAYEGALVRDGNHLGSVLNLAALHEAGGDDAAAVQLLRRALAIDAEKGGLSGEERRQIGSYLEGIGQSGS
jgi:tetratricopeptide (TPR) repeat protein